MKIVAEVILMNDWLNRSQRPTYLFGDDGQVYQILEDEQDPFHVRLIPKDCKRITFKPVLEDQ